MKAKHLLAVALLITAGCKKETARLSSDLQGKWELISSDDGWGGHHEYEPGNGNTFSFSANTYLQQMKATDTTYEYSGTFRIYSGKPCDFAREQTLIRFNDNVPASTFSLSDGKLTIGATECIADGSTSTYRKIH
jgi:hypothetical protein